MTASDQATTTLAALVSASPASAAVLDRLGLDYCCHGERPLAEACRDRGLDTATVIEALAGAVAEPPPQWEQLGPADLADDIVATHHRYLWDELPTLEELAAKVASVHGARHDELSEVVALTGALRADLEPHMLKEERVLFPAIHAVVGGERSFPFGTIRNPIHMMRLEHEQAGALLERLRAVTHGFDVPEDGCASYRSLFQRLAHLEADTHLHIHKENAVLFPAAAALGDEPEPE